MPPTAAHAPGPATCDPPALLLDPQGRVIAASARALERAGAEPVAELSAREGWPEVALRAGVRLRRGPAARDA